MKANKKLCEIEKCFTDCPVDNIPEIVSEYISDERPGVQKLIAKYQKKYDLLLAERARTEKMKEFEYKYSEYRFICGIDEVGRGPLAGPVTAAAVILPKDCDILYLNDSKQLSEKKREELYEIIVNNAVSVGIADISNERIDEINILQATYEAMRAAVEKLNVTPDLLLNDAVVIPKVSIKQVGIIKGDARSISIAAASIVAKVTRDHLMDEYDKIYPGYGFMKNKGYGTKEHIEMLQKSGPTPIHRKSFIKNFIN